MQLKEYSKYFSNQGFSVLGENWILIIKSGAQGVEAQPVLLTFEKHHLPFRLHEELSFVMYCDA